ncbi:hypothetical protein [Staphylococcus devriesei]|uniref:hypothetical protein n=1 Tax=Staphylococcus devriesei TaxID=586733 RepID=UPI000CD03E4D|nr:hypothetical protein [Staphylococcus devriesei]PNZ86241.1 hypothetical protein CD147_10200 [Staphylococcus devriesei]SUM03866.1 Uncharacterised protein [Staphylococcus devriesei]
MAEVKLSQESYDELLKDIEILKNKENKFNGIIAELRNENTDLKVNSEVCFNTCKDWIKNYDELINDIADIKRKAEAFDEIAVTVLSENNDVIKNMNNIVTNIVINNLERGSDET